jgi:hypothetical protein
VTTERGGRVLTVVTAAQIPPTFSLSPGGKWLAIWDRDADRLVQELAGGRRLAVAIVEEPPLRPGAPSLSPNGDKLVLGNDSRECA